MRLFLTLKKLAPIILLTAVMLLLVIAPSFSINSARRGLALFAASVLPALFPFFFFSSLLTQMGAAEKLGNLFEKPVKYLFNAPKQAAYVFAISLLSGYPVGAATIRDLYLARQITSAEAKRISSFCSTSGPIFVVGTLGAAIFQNQVVGLTVLISHYLATVLTGVFFRGGQNRQNTLATTLDNTSVDVNCAKVQRTNTDTVLQNAISSSTASMLAVGAYILLFNILIDFLIDSGTMSALFAWASSGNSAQYFKALIAGLIEMTRGTIEAQKTGLSSLSVALSGFFVSFGGLGIAVQSYSFLSVCHIKFSRIILQKAVQGILTFCIVFCSSLCFLPVV